MSITLLSNDQLGWMTGCLAAFSYGSFGVPVKSIPDSIQADPLVVQSYKSFMTFIISVAVTPIILGINEIHFTKMGIMSGLFWVPGGTAGIFAIRAAGLASSVGIWSTLNVVISFIWGVYVFNEDVKSKSDAAFAALFLITGLWGMSIYSDPSISAEIDPLKEKSSLAKGLDKSNHEVNSLMETGEMCSKLENCQEIIPLKKIEKLTKRETFVSTTQVEESNESFPLEIDHKRKTRLDTNVTVLGIVCERKRLGIICAIFNGVWGGSQTIPLHYSPYKGLSFVFSFAVGSAIITILMWIVRYVYGVIITRSPRLAYEQLPSFHVKEMVYPGSSTGALYCMGLFSTIMTITYLGQSIGNSLCQLSMLVSGLWGVFYFEEIRGSRSINRWFFSAGIALLGILLLGTQHVGASH